MGEIGEHPLSSPYMLMLPPCAEVSVYAVVVAKGKAAYKPWPGRRDEEEELNFRERSHRVGRADGHCLRKSDHCRRCFLGDASAVCLSYSHSDTWGFFKNHVRRYLHGRGPECCLSPLSPV